MAYRDAEMPSEEFLQFFLEMKPEEMMVRGKGPTLTFVNGCKGYVLPGEKCPREMLPDMAAMLAEWTGWGIHGPGQKGVESSPRPA